MSSLSRGGSKQEGSSVLFNGALRCPKGAKEGLYLPWGWARKIPGGLCLTAPGGPGLQPEGGPGAVLPPASGPCASDPLVPVWQLGDGGGLHTHLHLRTPRLLQSSSHLSPGHGWGAGWGRGSRGWGRAQMRIFPYPTCLSLLQACHSLNLAP